MITNNKILTVSYGTFSCTLEGFDDSFGTMKAIAEYFRDLASDDRYFGAEPPQPDVEMLARIAQKEISRRVEAREHEGNYVLSAVEDQPNTAPSAAVVTGAAVAGATAASALLQETTPVVEPAEADPVTEQNDDTTESSDQSYAEKPQADEPETQAVETEAHDADAEAQVDESTSQADEPEAQADEPVAQADEAADDQAEDMAEDQEPAGDLAKEEHDIVPGQPDSEVEAFFASNPTGTNQSDFEEVAELPAEIDTPAETPADAGGNTIAAKLQRIRAVVAQNDDAVEDEDYSEDEHAEDDSITVSESSADEIADAVEDASVQADAEDNVEAEIEDALASDDSLRFEDLQADTSDTQIEEDVLDIDDVEAASSEDAQGDDIDDAASLDDEDDIASILNRLDQAEAAEAEADTYGEDNAADTLLSEDLSEADDDGELLENLFDAEDAQSDDAAESDVQDAGDVSDEPVAAYAATAEQRVDAKPQKTAAEEALADAADAMAARSPRARVIKVKRADLNAAIKRGDLEEQSDQTSKRANLDQHHLAPGKFGTSSLSAEDEAELARELAALEADIEMDQPTAETDAPSDDLSETMTLSEDMRTDTPVNAELDSEDWTTDADEPELETSELDGSDIEDAIDAAEDEAEHQETAAQDDAEEDKDERTYAAATRRDAMPSPDVRRRGYMSRLLAETDQHMDEPEGATRRDAFAHLRAAVAAKKADDALGVGADTVEGDDAYRNDLADVVRPRRPGRSGARTPRPGEGGPAPLKLVAEQRIDTEDSTAADPVRPRRVETVDENPSDEGESFASFADEMGATTLPQQLEAAAAYMSFVEGREQFSRPQLMAKVRQVSAQDEFSREDGLRHFGQLLRSGKIEKVKGGRFTVSEDIGFRPDHRAAS